MFSVVKNCIFCLQIDPESFVMGFSKRSDNLLRTQEPHPLQKMATHILNVFLSF